MFLLLWFSSTSLFGGFKGSRNKFCEEPQIIKGIGKKVYYKNSHNTSKNSSSKYSDRSAAVSVTGQFSLLAPKTKGKICPLASSRIIGFELQLLFWKVQISLSESLANSFITERNVKIGDIKQQN